MHGVGLYCCLFLIWYCGFDVECVCYMFGVCSLLQVAGLGCWLECLFVVLALIVGCTVVALGSASWGLGCHRTVLLVGCVCVSFALEFGWWV